MPTLLITAGPTHEPIDRVRFIGNRSSGRLGVALADAAARSNLGWDVQLLLGPTCLTPSDSRVILHRFQTTADLEALLTAHVPNCDILIMAAAVADYRPRPALDASGKIQRTDRPLVIELEPTNDLLAGVAGIRRPDQTIVGFALEPRERLMSSASAKLTRKRLDFIVANPLETMDAPTIEATLIGRGGAVVRQWPSTSKDQFAADLLGLIAESRGEKTK
ncbi:MAG: phosphopantothenoylcysteine decarboxylase [Phycisphaerales bacterium]